MFTLSIRNPELDKPTAELVAKAFAAMTDHWKAILPSMEFMLSTIPFSRIPQLKEFCLLQQEANDPEKINWKLIHVACPAFNDQTAMLWIYRQSKPTVRPDDYYFRKHLYAVIASLMWNISEKLRVVIAKEVTGVAQESEGAMFLAFRDSFSRFFLNPEYLQERKPAAWDFMKRLDEAVRKGL